MDDQDVSLIGQVEEQEDPIMCRHLYTEADANFVKLKVNLQNIGVKVGSLVHTEVTNMKERW